MLLLHNSYILQKVNFINNFDGYEQQNMKTDNSRTPKPKILTPAENPMKLKYHDKKNNLNFCGN